MSVDHQQKEDLAAVEKFIHTNSQWGQPTQLLTKAYLCLLKHGSLKENYFSL